MRAYRFNPTLAHSVYATARSLNMNESEFVRFVLIEPIEKKIKKYQAPLFNFHFKTK